MLSSKKYMFSKGNVFIRHFYHVGENCLYIVVFKKTFPLSVPKENRFLLLKTKSFKKLDVWVKSLYFN